MFLGKFDDLIPNNRSIVSVSTLQELSLSFGLVVTGYAVGSLDNYLLQLTCYRNYFYLYLDL